MTVYGRLLKTQPYANRGEYVYSDLNFMTLQRLVEKITGKTLDEYVESEFYGPIEYSYADVPSTK